MINARPQINGNTREDFCEAYDAIAQVRHAIAHARQTLLNNVLNGRNYQHLAAGPALCNADRTRYFGELVKIEELLETFSGDIIKVIDA